jgi:hypothetical protein
MNGTLAVLAMYPYPSVTASWDRLYEAVAAEVPDAPTALRWDIDVHKTWLDPNLAIGMACGWPLVQTLGDAVRVIGTFSYDASEPGSHLYRSVIIARDDVPLARLADGHAAINSTDSLSGYVSLLSAFGLDTARPCHIHRCAHGEHRGSSQRCRRRRRDRRRDMGTSPA